VIGAVLAAMLVPVSGESVAEPRVFELPIRNGELPADQRIVRVRQGDDVTLRWTTDKALTIYLHGYDIEKSLSPRATLLMRFTARATGRFPIEIHAHGRGGERVLAYVEVHPR
jgi:hypothetical protein